MASIDLEQNAGHTQRMRPKPAAGPTRAGPSAAAPLRIGIVGAGGMGREHARAILRLGSEAEVVAVADADARAAEALRMVWPGAAAAATLSDLLRRNAVDVIHVCTPPETHAPLAEEALRAGCHVYVEKPFAHSAAATEAILELAAERKLKVCAGHQLLFEKPSRDAFKVLPALGDLVHVESYFSFRMVRQMVGGRTAPAADAQLIDVLPHPVYLLLHALERAAPGLPAEIEKLTVGPRGTVHAVIRRGPVSGFLTVTLEGRPVESYLRLVGTNGSVNADYVRGTVQRLIGPGVSGIDKALNPFRQGRQLITGTVAALGGRVLKRQKSYPGLAEIFTTFYAAIRETGLLPMQPESILETARVCEEVALQLFESGEPASGNRTAGKAAGPRVAVTGGTGFLGRELVGVLNGTGAEVRVLARRPPAPWERIGAADYRVVDLGEPLPPELLAGTEVVIHCAAETVGGWEQHERNSVKAAENLLRAAAAAGLRKLIHVSSLSVLSSGVGGALSEDTPVEPDSRSRGPYVWGKVESENLIERLGKELGIEVKIVRPGAIIDPDHFEQPGLLGKRAGNVFVAVGSPRERLAVVELGLAARTLAWMATNFERAPDILHLLSPDLPTKRSLLSRLRRTNPDLRVIWLPWPALVPLSWAAVALQKALRPRKSAVNPARVLAVDSYETTRMQSIEPVVNRAFSPAPAIPRGGRA